MAVSRFSLVIALLPTRNIQKMRQNEPFFALISYRTLHNLAKGMAMSTLKQYILCPLSSYCPSPGLVLSNLSRRIPYLFVLRQKHPSSNKTLPDSSRFSNLFAIFATSFRNYSGGTE